MIVVNILKIFQFEVVIEKMVSFKFWYYVLSGNPSIFPIFTKIINQGSQEYFELLIFLHYTMKRKMILEL